MAAFGQGSRPWWHAAHHDFPVEFERHFLKAGIDINHGGFGRWVHHSVHDSWSKAPGFDPGGPFNYVWREFFAKNSNPTQAQILDLLTEIRLGKEFKLKRKNLPDIKMSFKYDK